MNIKEAGELGRKLGQALLCLIGDHKWTCAAKEGMKPTLAQQRAGMAGFRDYAKMYCKSCGKISDLS